MCKVKLQHWSNFGYQHIGAYGITDREYFSKRIRKVHLYLYEVGDVHIAHHLKFIEVMHRLPALIEQLNRLHLTLYDLYPKNKK
jgi:hypothetical protein